MRDIANPDVDSVMRELSLFFPRFGQFFRAITYALVAYLLLSVNTYGIAGHGILSLTIGLLGIGHRSAFISQLAIVILMLMAIVPTHLVGL